jgi:hypothetical protein
VCAVRVCLSGLPTKHAEVRVRLRPRRIVDGQRGGRVAQGSWHTADAALAALLQQFALCVSEMRWIPLRFTTLVAVKVWRLSVPVLQ